MALNKKEIEAEIKSVECVIEVHESAIKLNSLGLRANAFIKDLLVKSLDNFK